MMVLTAAAQERRNEIYKLLKQAGAKGKERE
jgi:hypothetical protein